jgi:hypothetical protein
MNPTATDKIETLTTRTLKSRLLKTADIKGFIIRYGDKLSPEPLHLYLKALCEKRGEPSERIIKRANIERSYGHQFFSGLRIPSREKLLQLAFGFELDVEETQELLKRGQKNLLYPKIKRDAVIMFCLERKMSIDDAREVLQDLELPLLGGE